VDLVTLENNHVRNYGTAGVTETIKTLEAAHVTWAGGGSPAVIDVRGVKFGFLAYNGVGERFNRKTMVAKIKELRPKVDVLVAAMHWGAEYVVLPTADPSIAPDNPVEIARLAVDAGVDLIIGNHPHWIQPVELYKGKLIAYAHGNFIFDQMWSEETRKGVIGRYTFYDHTLVKVEYIPVMIQDYAQPVPLQGKASQDVLDRMKAASQDLARKPSPSP
jgi:poly-gamma-glutamate capsule biosynthesis protein CapA/YwtB (metallophosphatase superfamily)